MKIRRVGAGLSHVDGETARRTDCQTDRQTDKQTDRQKDRQTDRQKDITEVTVASNNGFSAQTDFNVLSQIKGS